jgi:hypothetical protein
MIKKSTSSSPKPKVRTPRRKRTRDDPPRHPSPAALALLRRANERVKGRSADGRHTPVRHAFVERASHSDNHDPPAANLLRASKGGALRLKLYLALLWQAGGGDERHAATWPARAWAELLDLPDPEGHGDRRIRDAIRALERAQLLKATREPGRPIMLTLLRDDGTANPYVHPGEVASAAKKQGAVDLSGLYVQLPPGFWTKGWAITLSGPGTVMLLVMQVLTKNGLRKGQWISPKQARSRFGLSEDTWTRGVAELRRHGLLETRKKPVSEDFGWRRVRNTYTLNCARLDTGPDGLS